MNKFYYSRTYIFEAPKGRRKYYFFNLVERFGECASFRLNHKDNEDVIPAIVKMDGETETTTFFYRGFEYSLRADRFISKGYRLNVEGRMEEKDDRLKDAHLHTSHNRDEIGRSEMCCCISCKTIFKPEEVVDYADGGQTAICPYCDCDAVLGNGCRFKLTDEFLESLYRRYF
ncbi:MAG: hypothetical protein K2N05_12005 [Muribaculaceae bacterium]|nr:hypothetical protein [Muribaculaceae bacterium]